MSRKKLILTTQNRSNGSLGLAAAVTGSLLVMGFEAARECRKRIEAGADRDFLQLQTCVDHHAPGRL